MEGFDLSTVQGIYKGSTLVDSVYLVQEKVWPPHDYSQDYLTITSLTDNNSIGWKADSEAPYLIIYVSTDNGATWGDHTSFPGGSNLAVLNTGEKLLIKGANASYFNDNDKGSHFTSTNNFDISGNIMSLVYGDNFRNKTILQEARTFCGIFRFSKVVSAQNLVLPATTLTQESYRGMFYECSGLITGPELPALQLANGCYQEMFYDCGNLNYIKCLATDISATDCLTDWVAYVSSTGMFIKNASASSWPTGANGIPEGWAIQNI